jgi:hypothetical protein
MGCPCKEGRYGAFGLCVSSYWAMQCGGIEAMLNLVAAENGMGIWWAIWSGLAVLLLAQGIREALSHDDNFDGQSVAVSIGLIGVALYALANHWFWVGPEWTTHVSRVFGRDLSPARFLICGSTSGAVAMLRLCRKLSRNGRRASLCTVAAPSKLWRSSRGAASRPKISLVTLAQIMPMSGALSDMTASRCSSSM